MRPFFFVLNIIFLGVTLRVVLSALSLFRFACAPKIKDAAAITNATTAWSVSVLNQLLSVTDKSELIFLFKYTYVRFEYI